MRVLLLVMFWAMCPLGGAALAAADPDGPVPVDVDPDLLPDPPPAPPADAAPPVDPDLSGPDPAPTVDPDLGASRGEGDAVIDDVDSFALELEALGLQVQISGYGDVLFQADSSGKNNFDVTHFNPIFSARLGRKVRAEIELEFEHSGSVQRVEYAVIDFELARAVNLRLGKLLVPIGKFNAGLHPSFRWRQISRPAMFRDVVPAVWADVGLQLFGTVKLAPGHFFSYDAYLVNGLGGDRDMALDAEPIRALRDGFPDIDRDKGVGGRLGLRLFDAAEVGATELGVSFYTGELHAQDHLRYSALDVDLSLALGPVKLMAEFAQSFLGSGPDAFEPFETGAYVLLLYQLTPFQLSVRLDTTLGKPLGAEVGTWSHALVPGVIYAPEAFWSVRIEAGLPLNSSTARELFSAMVAFSF